MEENIEEREEVEDPEIPEELMEFEYCRDKRTRAGKHRCRIVDAELGYSSRNNQQIVVQLEISRSPLKIKHFIVFNDNFNYNMSRFYDAFPSLNRSKDFSRWKGAVGAVELKEGKKGYLDVKACLTPKEAAGLPEFKPFDRKETWERGESEWLDWPDDEPEYEMDQVLDPFGNP